MKYKNIVVTGGAGFIGSFLTEELLKHRYNVTIFDNLEDQVHRGQKPKYILKDIRFIKGDVRNSDAFNKVIKKADVVYHLAAAVGVQQSQYEIKRFVDVNVGGMGNLLNSIVTQKTNTQKLILMSSMTGYGEGMYICDSHGRQPGNIRNDKQLAKNVWEMLCEQCHKPMKPVATSETAPLSGNSMYALTKKYQEELLMSFSTTYNIPAVAFRGFNIYGPRQSISNPYTGVTAIFISRLKNGNMPVVYEDGLQTRDFISVHDVVDALLLPLSTDKADNHVLNLGSGKPSTILETARMLAQLLGSTLRINPSGNYRKKDIRHCFADTTKIRTLLGWSPSTSLQNGFRELVQWAMGEKAEDLFEKAERELKQRKLST